jgi:hypothetical protein
MAENHQTASESGVGLTDLLGDVPLYSVGTWDGDEQSYTPQIGLTVPSFNMPLRTLRRAMRELIRCGYSCHRRRDADGDYEDNDTSVLIERTDGRAEEDIRRDWQR